MTGYFAEFDPSDWRCCELATKRVNGCVCRHVVVCVKHGDKHVGRH